MVSEGDRHPIPGVGNIELEGMIGEEGFAFGGGGDRFGRMAGVVVDEVAEAAAGEIKAVAIARLSVLLSPFPFCWGEVGPLGGLGCGVDQPGVNLAGG